jgi:hypothetical protein
MTNLGAKISHYILVRFGNRITETRIKKDNNILFLVSKATTFILFLFSSNITFFSFIYLFSITENFLSHTETLDGIPYQLPVPVHI